MPNPINVGYVIYNDRPNSGLIRTQVFSVLREICKSHPSIRVTVMALWQPWVYFKYRKSLAAMKAGLLADGIVLENWPIALFPNRFFLFNRYTLPFLRFVFFFAFCVLRLSRFDIVHSRSYFPSLIVASLKKYLSLPSKSIFDLRSLFPEEYITVGKWTEDSPVYDLWKDYERFAVMNSDEFIAVSEAMKAEADKIVPGRKARLIALAADIDKLSFDQAARDRIRSEMGWERSFVIAYQGSLGFDNLWNNIRNYAEYFSRMLAVEDRVHLLFAVPVAYPQFWDVIDEFSIDRTKVTFVEEPARLGDWLSASDAGIHVMSPGPDGHTRLGVKVVEYLSCGLPVITNSNVGAAADFVESHNVGIRLDLNGEFNTRLQAFVAASYRRDEVADVAHKNFSASHVAGLYAGLYLNLATPNCSLASGT